MGTAVVTQGEWKKPRADPYVREEEKKPAKRDCKNGQGCGPGLCHCPLLSEESASGSLMCPLSVLQSPVSDFFCVQYVGVSRIC